MPNKLLELTEDFFVHIEDIKRVEAMELGTRSGTRITFMDFSTHFIEGVKPKMIMDKIKEAKKTTFEREAEGDPDTPPKGDWSEDEDVRLQIEERMGKRGKRKT